MCNKSNLPDRLSPHLNQLSLVQPVHKLWLPSHWHRTTGHCRTSDIPPEINIILYLCTCIIIYRSHRKKLEEMHSAHWLGNMFCGSFPCCCWTLWVVARGTWCRRGQVSAGRTCLSRCGNSQPPHSSKSGSKTHQPWNLTTDSKSFKMQVLIVGSHFNLLT